MSETGSNGPTPADQENFKNLVDSMKPEAPASGLRARVASVAPAEEKKDFNQMIESMAPPKPESKLRARVSGDNSDTNR
jgi:hypothetical protein